MASAIKTLTQLPDVFTATAAAQLGKIKDEQFKQVMWRWKVAGLVKPIGDRSNVYINLIVDKEVTRERWERAVQLAMPQSILAGHGVLMRAAVMTQMASLDYLIRPPRTASKPIDQATVQERPLAWMKKLKHTDGAIDSSGILPHLDPGVAIADLLLFDSGAIDPDDIEWHELSERSTLLYRSLMAEAGVDAPGPSARERHRQHGAG